MSKFPYESLPQDERQKFEDVCGKHGFKAGDFQVECEEIYPEGGSGPIDRTVKVTRRITKDYIAGPGTSWTMEFEIDLSKSYFGRPRRRP